jgi:hypothetical protein
MTENNNKNMEKKKKEVAQKDSTLQPITKPKTKLDKELQEWEVESTKTVQMMGRLREKKK